MDSRFGTLDREVVKMKCVFRITAILNLSLVATAYFCVIIGAINKDVDFLFMSALTTLFSIFPNALMIVLCNDFKDSIKNEVNNG